MSENIDDRATRESISAFLSDTGGSPSVRPVPDDSGKPSRSRQLRPTFRARAADSTGFPGTSAFSARRTDRGAAGATLQPAAERTVSPLTPAPGANDLEGWRVAIQQAGADSRAIGPAVAAAESADGGRLRGWGAEGARTAADSASRSRTANDTVVRTPSGAKGAGRGAAKKPAKAGPALPKDIAKLIPKDAGAATPRVIVPTPTERATAASLFREIGDRFNTNRKKSKTAAYAGYRHDLMANLDTLVMGGALDLKDATTIITNLEQYTKETEAESTETPATILGRWLRMSAEEVAGLEAPVEEVVEDEEKVEEEEELAEEIN